MRGRKKRWKRWMIQGLRVNIWRKGCKEGWKMGDK